MAITDFEDPIQWDPILLKHEVLNEIGDEEVRSIWIECLNQTSAVTNELLRCINILNLPESGLESLTLSEFAGLE